MRAFRTPLKTKAVLAVPLDIYASLVGALYEVQPALFVGLFSAQLAALITAWKANSLILLGCSLAIALVAAARVLDMRRFARAGSPDRGNVRALRAWEHRYVAGAAVYIGLLGTWCLACFLVTEDPFVRLLSFSMVLGFLLGTVGRNFASPPLVISQILGAGIPLTAALFSVGGLYYIAFAAVLVPFFASLKLISDRLRRTLLDAVITARDITQLAARFTTALNNMPHGLVMFDAAKRLVVANGRFSELLALPADADLAGRSSRELLLAGRAFTGLAGAEAVIADLDKSLSGTPGEVTTAIKDDRLLAFTTRPMENGGSVVIVEDVTERRNAEQRIQRLARFDSLTGLPNRNQLHERLERLLPTVRPEAPLAVLFVDLDGFKQVNDTLGHLTGDQLLGVVADRLRVILSSSEIVTRFGGDEFIALHQMRGPSAAEAEDLAKRIVTGLSPAYQINGHDVIIGASVGIAMAPRDGADPDLLLKNADLALYHAKANGKAGWRVFDPTMDAAVNARRAFELDLRQTVASRGFELYYQPIMNVKTMRVCTCEALLRWNHPERGMVPPSEFIPVAEAIGVIVEIGAWVIQQACLECAQWPADVSVAVNLSPVQFGNDMLGKVVSDALKAANLAPGRLELEITESLLLRDTPAVRAILQKLVDIGARISLDDFGTGYSSLSYLHTFPLHKVKIDRSFVSQMHSGDRSMTLLKGVARLSAALDLTVAVEGVETDEQLDIIVAEDSIDEVQGYVFSVPLPAASIRELIARQSVDPLQAAAADGATGPGRRPVNGGAKSGQRGGAIVGHVGR